MSVTRSSSYKASLDSDFKKELSSLIKDEIVKAMICDEMKNAISSQVKDLIQNELASIIKPLEEELVSVKIENASLRKDLTGMKNHIKSLSLQANANEQYSRKYNIRIAGIEEIDGEDCYKAASIFFETELGVTVNDSEIDRVHRLGKRGLAPRQMIVKFKGYRAKEAVIKNRRKLKGRKGIYVNEDLTIYNLDLYRKARLADHIVSTWSSDGKIFVKLADESIHVVRSPEDILALRPNE